MAALNRRKGTLSQERVGQPRPGPVVADSLSEVHHVAVPDPGRQGLDRDQMIGLVEIGRVGLVESEVQVQLSSAVVAE